MANTQKNHKKKLEALKDLTPLEWIKYFLTTAYALWALGLILFSQISGHLWWFLLMSAALSLSFLQFLVKPRRDPALRLFMDLILAGVLSTLIFASVNFFGLSLLFLLLWGGTYVIIIIGGIILLFSYSKLSLTKKIIHISAMALLAIILASGIANTALYYTNINPDTMLALIEDTDARTAAYPNTLFRGNTVFLFHLCVLLLFDIFQSGILLAYIFPPILILIAKVIRIIIKIIWKTFKWLTKWTPPQEERNKKWQQFFNKKRGYNSNSHNKHQQHTHNSNSHRYHHQHTHNARSYGFNNDMQAAYDFFGLSRDCSREEFKTNFRKRQKVLHPDVNQEKEGATELSVMMNKYAKMIKDARGWS
jgi:hypothetical protein